MLGSGWTVEDLTAHSRIEAPEESGATFAENARIKALAASHVVPDALVLSDDSGLEVDALGGAPGVRSARYAGAGATDADNRAKLKRELRMLMNRGLKEPISARFRCCMCLAGDGCVLAEFDGAVEGRLLLDEEGTGGFGYDSLFVPEGFQHSFGVLPPETKNGLSHRARALAKVVQWLAHSRP